MSSFLVEDKTINTIIDYLANDNELGYIRRSIKKDLGFDLETYKGKEELGKLMFKLNCKATGERYHDSEGIGLEDFRPLNYKYMSTPCYNQFSALKSLSCWLYQCAEGETYASDIYKFFEQLKNELAYHILIRLPEYDKAQGWH